MYDERRAVKEDSPLYELLKGIEPGQVLSEPYPDFGGFCVIRVKNLLPRRRMPLQYLRGAAFTNLEFRYYDEFHRSFAVTLLEKHKYVLNDDVLTRMVREGAKP
jgi:hypothetical protein